MFHAEWWDEEKVNLKLAGGRCSLPSIEAAEEGEWERR